ncbi:YtxH domain-containing protein [Clostridium oceanicum]|uniref:YtxH-like protein n=1 Tax=Clostridium oceanicum TaxID=1543 RepID=A0ABP3V1Y9_9CLOT
MRGKFISGMMLGVAAGMMLSPQIDKKTKRKIKRSGKNMMNMAEDMYDNVRYFMK